MSKPGKFVYAQVYRGFESLSLRIKAQNKVPKGHLVYFKKVAKSTLLSRLEGNNNLASERRQILYFQDGSPRDHEIIPQIQQYKSLIVFYRAQ
jgi:hypothetical protein